MFARFCPALTVATVLATTLTLACDDASSGSAPGDLALREGPGQGGPVLNTSTLLTSELATVDTQGAALNGVALLDVELRDGAVYTSIDAGSLRVDHGTLVALVQGTAFSGPAFAGSRWTFEVDGVEVVAHLMTVETADDAGLYDPSSPDDLRKLDPERFVYTFHWLDDTQHPHVTCKEDAVGGARTVLYGDITVDHTLGEITARPDSIYFGCISGAVGKAALWGYAPDSPSLTSVTLPDFETATRAVRADYCANGVSHTMIGNELTLADRWSINQHTVENFTTEAVWSSGGGARCLRRIRKTGASLLAPFQCPGGALIPLCSNEANLKNRWATDASYGVLWTKLPL